MVKLIHKSTNYTGLEEDWWHLEVDDEGNHCVRHSWDYQQPEGVHTADSGDKRYSIEEFLTGIHSVKAKSKLKELLEEFS